MYKLHQLSTNGKRRQLRRNAAPPTAPPTIRPVLVVDVGFAAEEPVEVG